MSKKGIVVGVALLVLSSVGTAAAAPIFTFNDGNDYRTLMTEGDQLSYLMGLVDAMTAALYVGGNPNLSGRLSTCFVGMKVGQVKAIVDLYLKNHPELWDQAMALTVWDAMKEACTERGHPFYDKAQ
jgi:hypothetical protein